MNSPGRSARVLGVLLVVAVRAPSVPPPAVHARRGRAYGGADAADGQLPYVVFVSAALVSSSSCVAVSCTGTLVHPRHVLTLLSCVTRDDFRTDDVKISLSRPYERAGRDAAFNVVDKVHHRPTGMTDALDHDNVALLVMNGTFPAVTRFPRLASLQPVAHGTALSCTTAGFSLAGRDLSRPVAETVKPAAYSVVVEFDADECVNRRDPTDRNVYLCRASGGRTDRTLCGLGDEGGPLLCDKPAGRDRRDADADADDDGLYVYGMANVVPGAAGCRHGGAEGRADVLYLYMYKYHFWAGVILTVYDEYEDRDGGTANGPPPPTTTTTTTTEHARLSEYYDTGDYDRTAGKKAIRCDGRRENAAAARVSVDVLVVVASSLFV